MNKELIEALNVLEKEKDISKEVILEAIENSLLTAYKVHFGKCDNVTISIDHQTGDYKILAEKEVVEIVEDKATQISLEDAKEIIELETVSLIENSFTLGYKLSNPAFLSVPDAIINIGHSCGYCFQVLNDMEPFSAPHINQKYKGNINYDFEKHRKNIVISYLYGCCTQRERKQLETTSDFEYLCRLVKKYDVLATLLNELESEIIEIMQQCLYFKNSNLQYYNDFKKFLMVMFNICYKKCELPLKNELFNN